MLRGCAAQLLLATLAFLLLYVITGPEGSPGGSHFALLVLYLAALWVGKLTAPFLPKLPPLLPMLVVGFLLRTLPELGRVIGSQVDPEWSSALRLGALTLILTRAGLAMDLNALLRLRFVVLRLAMLPCLCEAATAALLATWLLDFPPLWAAMLGFVVAAISPAVVVPSLLTLQDQGYGVEAGIPTMVVAAAPLDDVLSIAGFGICLGISFAESSWLNYARAPLELLLGLSTGMIGAGLLVVLTPSSEEDGAKELRLLLLLSAALSIAFGLREVGFSGAAALAVLVLGAGCARGWGPAAKPVSASVADLWTRLAQPLLFSLVGASVVVTGLETETLAAGLLIILLGGLVRAVAVMLALSGRGMKHQEKLFTAIAWTPKATVQAALGGLALDEAREDAEQLLGRRLLAVAVLCILVTAPPGATLIALMGPRLLQKVDKPEVEETGPEKPDEVVPEETLPGELEKS